MSEPVAYAHTYYLEPELESEQLLLLHADRSPHISMDRNKLIPRDQLWSWPRERERESGDP